MRTFLLFTLVSFGASCGDDGAKPQQDAAPGDSFSFFITSTGNPNGGDFRRTPSDTDGLAGADEFCRSKAIAAVPASASRQWRAYLSTDTVHAKDRIGQGPWFDRKGIMVAASITALLDPATNMINKTTGLDENGTAVPGRGDTPNQHDIITGTAADGTATTNHCRNWTSSAATGEGDFNPVHHDEDFAKSAGLPSVMAHGMLSAGLLASFVTRWFGADSVRRYKVRFRERVWPGDVLRATGRVVELLETGAGRRARLELSLNRSDGKPVITGSAEVALD